jgi:WD40 repeat protein
MINYIGYCLHRLKGHNNDVSDLLYIDKAYLLLSGSYDYTIKVWDANNSFNCISRNRWLFA